MNKLPPVNSEQPWHQLALDGDGVAASLRRRSRDRVTIDLRGIGARLHSFCAARGTAVSAAVRLAVLSFLDREARLPPPTVSAASGFSPVAKLSLRLDARHAAQLTERAHVAAVSRGTYIASLLDAMPPSPRSPDHREAVASLVRSTQQLAKFGTDLNACLRHLDQCNQPSETAALLTSLSDETRHHLRIASALLASLTVPPRAVVNRDQALNGTCSPQ
ncbi:MAG: hypothetical protein ABI671_00080 [Burkholderiales bacterium]